MSNVEDDDRIAATTRTLQVMMGALTVGVLIFLAITMAIGRKPPVGQPFLTGFGVVLTIVTLAVRLILPRQIVAGTRRRLARGEVDLTAALCGLYQSKTILGAALVEGTAYLMVIAYFVERSRLALALAILLALGVASHFPTRARIEGWIERQRELIEEERQLAR